MIQQKIDQGIATLTVARPEKRNSLRATDKRELADAILGMSQSPDARAIVLTGAGEHAFCAGSDISEMSDFGPQQMHAMLEQERAMYVAVLSSPKPVVAAVNGFALGAGLILVMCCDYSVASSTAQLGTPELSIGVAAPLEGLMLPQLIGLARARELFFLSRRVEAPEAKAIGLINETVEQATVLERAHTIARDIASLPGGGFQTQKRLLTRLILSESLESVIVESDYATSLLFEDGATSRALSKALRKRD